MERVDEGIATKPPLFGGAAPLSTITNIGTCSKDGGFYRIVVQPPKQPGLYSCTVTLNDDAGARPLAELRVLP